MYIHKVNEYEVIFDSQEHYNLVTCLKGTKSKRRKIWIDTSSSKPYARLSFEGKDVRVHHILVGCPLNGRMVDHFNGNSLDNRLENLRVVSRSESQYNKPTKNNHRWITKQKNGKFQVMFRIGLGTYSTLEEAKSVAAEFIKNKNINIFKDFL